MLLQVGAESGGLASKCCTCGFVCCICVLQKLRGGAEGTAFQIAAFSFFYSLLGQSYYKLDLGAIFFLSCLNAFPSRYLWSR